MSERPKNMPFPRRVLIYLVIEGLIIGLVLYLAFAYGYL